MARLRLSFLYLALLMSGCLDFETGREEMSPIESKIRISTWENLSAQERTLTLTCATEKTYGCINYSIVSTKTILDDSIMISFTGIYKPPVCLTALGPAGAAIDLGSLPSGNYPLSLSANGETVRAQLVVSDDAYTVNNGEGMWTTFSRSQLRRVPDGTIWGLVGYHTTTSAALAQAYLDSVRIVGAQPCSCIPGYYGYYEIDSTANIQTPGNHGYAFAQSYIYHYGGDPLVVRNLVKRYGKSLGDSLSISLFGSHAEAYFSWILQREP